MLESLLQAKLPAAFLIIQDTEDVGSHDLFIAFLKNCEKDTSIKKIHLICFENPPAFYVPNKELQTEKVVFQDFFTDPFGWSKTSAEEQDFSLLPSHPNCLSDTAIFIDSLSLLAYHKGFFATCWDLKLLKRYSKNVLCVVHGDLFSLEQLEQLSFFASACIKLQDNFSSGGISKERMCEVMYKKPGGKIIKQKEFFSISDQFMVTSRIAKTESLVLPSMKKDIENLSTFKLGLHISEGEKKARDQLVLPYLRNEVQNKVGEIIYQPEADDFEDDPDDDLDI